MKDVTVGEVVRHAKPSCKSCHGTGAVAKWIWSNGNTQTRTEEVCRCARKRFLRENSEKIQIVAAHDWKWKEAA